MSDISSHWMWVSSSLAGDLKIHVESKHEGVRYPCSQCEHAATTAEALKIHVKSKHDGVRYPCPECEFYSTTASYLKKHIAKKHKWVIYPWVCLNFNKQSEETDLKQKCFSFTPLCKINLITMYFLF